MTRSPETQGVAILSSFLSSGKLEHMGIFYFHQPTNLDFRSTATAIGIRKVLLYESIPVYWIKLLITIGGLCDHMYKSLLVDALTPSAVVAPFQ